ncbi:hypothetical protein [Cupriavidus pampae]|uniref:PRTRC system protein E n=1 Tax=Cupriavidus pampae TaxID=659251 RepID=A0ABN7YWB5_9BURK|nr:hypothetical protein [Cupriavidus pampae]CAG9177740.1 hypothetical protein LMG32289_03891 [Cupriavidus pampae]
MKIKFKATDPRAGTVVQMDSSRGQHFIDTGAAVLVKEDDHRSAVARAELDKALAGLPGDNTDPDYVVGAMRSHFKDVFTDADEAKVRALVKAPAAGAPEGQTASESAASEAAPVAAADEKPAAEAKTKAKAKGA